MAGKKYIVESIHKTRFELEILAETDSEILVRDSKTGKEYRVKLLKRGDGKLLVDVNGAQHVIYRDEANGLILLDNTPLLVQNVRAVAEKKVEKEEKKPVAEEGVVEAPITGKIVDVKVSPGSEVKVGDVLFLMESMKMIIEVKSPFAGVVEEIYAGKGSAVNRGEKLARIKVKK